jgi:large subunit ribosomal protein L17
MTHTARRYQAGYRNPITDTRVLGISEDPDADPGYYDLELEIWIAGIPDISSGEWIPEQAILATDRECPPTFPVKGNLPSRVYHLPDDATYARTIPEICFADADAAMMAGFRPSRARKRHE